MYVKAQKHQVLIGVQNDVDFWTLQYYFLNNKELDNTKEKSIGCLKISLKECVNNLINNSPCNILLKQLDLTAYNISVSDEYYFLSDIWKLANGDIYMVKFINEDVKKITIHR